MIEKVCSKKKLICYFIFFVSITIGFLAQRIVVDDFWWHLKMGEIIVNTKSIPDVTLSWTKAGEPWMAHEWLYEACLYLSTKAFGITGSIYFYMILSLGLLGVTLFIYNRKKYEKNVFYMMMNSVFILYMVSRVSTPRPHVLGLWLFLLLVICCEKMKTSESNKWLLFIPISIFWANWHGGSSSLLYIIPIIYFFTNTIEFSFGRIESKKSTKSWKYIIFALCNACSILCNPLGYKLILYPYKQGIEHTLFISEWDGLKWQSTPLVVLMTLFFVAILIITNKKILLSDAAMLGAFMMLEIIHIRFCGYLAIVGCIFLSKYVMDISLSDIERGLYWLYGIFGIMIILMLSFAIRYSSHDEIYLIPDEGIEIIKSQNPQKLFNSYYLGGYLLYNDIPVFIDARADPYEDILKESFCATNFYEYSFKELVDKYDFDLYVCYDYEYCYSWLNENSNFLKLWHDEDTKVAIFRPTLD